MGERGNLKPNQLTTTKVFKGGEKQVQEEQL